MRPQEPVVDVLIARDGTAWRLYSATHATSSPTLSRHANERGDVYPVRQPDLDGLHEFMWSCDAPYDVRPLVDGGAEICARGRSAVCLWVWLADLVPGEQ